MILNNAKPRLEEAYKKANETKTPQEVKFIYNKMNTHDTITSVFEWLFKQSWDFTTRHDKYRFVILIHPKKS